jgi:hypothetical protein
VLNYSRPNCPRSVGSTDQLPVMCSGGKSAIILSYYTSFILITMTPYNEKLFNVRPTCVTLDVFSSVTGAPHLYVGRDIVSKSEPNHVNVYSTRRDAGGKWVR